MTTVVKGRRGFVKGGGKLPGSGRKKGTPNKVTVDIARTMQMLAENLTPELEEWIRRTARRNPERATALVLTGLEFVRPKLQRTEMTGLDGAAFSVELSSKDSKL